MSEENELVGGLFWTITAVYGALDGVGVSEDVGVVEARNLSLKLFDEISLIKSLVFSVNGGTGQNPSALILLAITDRAAIDHGVGIVVSVNNMVITPSTWVERNLKFGLAFDCGN